MPIVRSLAVLAVALITFATATLSPLPVAAADPVPGVPVDEIVAGLDEVLARMAGEITDQVETIGDVPLAGDELDDVLGPITEGITEARSFLATWLVPTAETGGDARAELFLEGALWTLLGPDDALDHPDLDSVVRDALRNAEVPGLGLDLLIGPGGVPAAPGDVEINTTVDFGAAVVGVELRFEIGQSLDLDLPASFDLGLSADDAGAAPFIPNFGVDLALTTGLDVNLAWSGIVHVGIDVPIGGGSSAKGPYIDAESGLSAEATVSIAPGPNNTSGFSGRVALGLLQAEFSDGVIREDTKKLERTSMMVEARVGMAGDGKLFVSDLNRDSLDASLTAKAELRLQVRAGVDHLTDALNSAIDAGEFVVGMPSIHFSLIADPELTVGIGAGAGGVGADAGLDEIRFENITVDMREFLRGVMVPMARNVAAVTAPVTDALGLDDLSQQQKDGLLNEPLPVISDLAGEDQSLRSLGLDEEFEDLTSALTDFANFGDQVIDYINGPEFEDDIGNGGQLPLPCLVIVLEKKSVLNVKNIRRPALCEERKIESELQNFDPKVEVDISIAPSVFQFDLLSTESLYNLLLGNNIDIVSIGLPTVEATATAEPSLDLEVIEIDIKANAHAEVGLRLVYDTAGIAALVDQQTAGHELDLSVLADGFYLENRPGECATSAELAKDFADRDHGCEIGVGAGFDGRLQLGPDELNAWGEVDIAGDLGFQVIDPDDNGQLRGRELAALTDDWANPEKLFCLFDLRAAGRLYAAAGVVSPIGDETASLPNVAGEFSLIELLGTEFDVCTGASKPVAEAPAPILASVSSSAAGDTLLVHTGEYSALRRAGDRIDDEALTIDVTGDSSNLTVRVHPLIGEGTPADPDALTQTFSGNFSSIMISGGPLGDTITVGPGIDTYVRSHDGNDQVVTSGGDDKIDTGDGQDHVEANGGADTIDGGNHRDELDGGAGPDIIRGDGGADVIDGGPDGDLIDGGADIDTIRAGSGPDSVNGGGGDDTIDGGSEADQIDGGSGNDNIEAGPGDDDITAGLGHDLVFGGAGNDNITTGSGNDFVAGDADRTENPTCNALRDAPSPDGSTGDDVIRTGAGNDTVVPGGGEDSVDADLGDDCVFSQSGADRIDVASGDDEVGLAAVDLLQGRTGQTGAVGERAGQRLEILGAETFRLQGDTTTIAELNGPATVDASALTSLVLNETDEDLLISRAARIEIAAKRPSNGLVSFGPVQSGQVRVDGHGKGLIDAPATARFGYVGTPGPDEVSIAVGTDVAVSGGEGADRVFLSARAGSVFGSTVDGGPDDDIVVLDFGPGPAALDGRFGPVDTTPFGSVEAIVIEAFVIDGRIGWDDGVLTADDDGRTIPLVNIGSAESVRLPNGLTEVAVDAADAGGRSVELNGDTLTIGGARAIPSFEPVDPRSFNVGDEIGVLRATGQLEIYRATGSAEKVGERSLAVSDALSVAAANIDGGDIDEVVTLTPTVRTIFSLESSFTTTLRKRTSPDITFDDRSAASSTSADGSERVLSIGVANGGQFCAVRAYDSLGANQTIYECPLDRPVAAGSAAFIPTRLGGSDGAVHLQDGLASELQLLARPQLQPGPTPRSKPVILHTLTSSLFDGPVSGISCPHGERFAAGAGLRTIRIKEGGSGVIGAISATTPSEVVSVEEIDGVRILARLADGQVHLDDFCLSTAGRSSINTGIDIGAADLVFAGNLLRDTPPPSTSTLSEPNTSVTPVTITAPDAARYKLSTGDAIDSYLIAQTDADVDVDSGAGGDLVNLDLNVRTDQHVAVATGAGSDQVGVRVGGEPGDVVVETGSDGDLVDLLEGPARGSLRLRGDAQDDLLRVHPAGLLFSFGSGGTTPATPDDSVHVGPRVGVGYTGFETVRVNAGPIVGLSAPASVPEGSIVDLSADGSRSPDGQQLSYSWDVDGDGVFGDRIERDITVLFDDDGPRRVAVRVTDTDGRSSQRSATVSVNVVEPSVGYFIPETSATTGFPIHLISEDTNNLIDDTVSALQVDWGDDSPPESVAPGTAEHVYATSGNYTVTVLSVTDDDGTFDFRGLSTNIAVRDPEVSAVAASRVAEGSPTSLDLTAAPGAPAVRGWIVDWSDGQQDVLGGGDQSVSRTFDGPAVVVARVTALFGFGVEFALDPTFIVVEDVPPTFGGFVPPEADEGPVTIFLKASDTGRDPITSWRIDWGDATTDELPGSATEADHIFAPGTYQVTVVAINDDGEFPIAEQELVVANLRPVIRSLVASDAVEGGGVNVVVDAADVDPTGLSFEFSAPGATEPKVMSLDGTATLTFPDDGPQTIKVEVTDQFGLTASDSIDVAVSNVAPAASIRLKSTTGRILEGDTIEVAVDAIDRGDDTPQSALVDWGDGSPLEFVPLSADGQATLAHSYPDGSATIQRAVERNGKFFIGEHEVIDEQAFVVEGDPQVITLVSVIDEDGVHPIDDVIKTEVVDVSPKAAATIDTVDGEFRLTVASITDPGEDTIETHRVDWGDGIVETFPGAPAPGTVFTHTEAAAPQPIQLVLIDEDGSHIAASFSVAEVVAPEPQSVVVDVRAWGESGQEEMVVSFGSMDYEFDVTKDPAVYSVDLGVVDLGAVGSLSVRFVNDRYVPGLVDRNLVVDHIVVREGASEVVYESEDPSVYSSGVYVKGTGCGSGFVSSDKLACNGEFRFDLSPVPTPSEPRPVVVDVRAWGESGQEEMVVSFGSMDYEFDVTKDPAVYSVDLGVVDLGAVGSLSVRFVNDRYVPGLVDRNLVVDHIVVREGASEVVYESEDPSVYSSGVYVKGTGCGSGFVSSDKLACNGEFRFDLSATLTPPEPVVVDVRARGYEGDEKMTVDINGSSHDFDVAKDFASYRVELPAGTVVSELEVHFVNDLYMPGVVDRNLVVDNVSIGEKVFETEDPSVYSTSSLTRASRCVPGFARSERLACNGSFTYVVS